MNKNIIIGVTISLLAVGGVFVFAQQQKNQHLDEFEKKAQEAVQKINQSQLIQAEFKLERGMFASKGFFNLSKDQTALKTNYEISHSFTQILFGNVGFDTTTELDAKAIPLQTDGFLFKTNSTVSSDKINTKINFSNLSINSAGQTLSILPITGNTIYDKTKKDFEMNLTMPKVSFAANKMEIGSINNIKIFRKLPIELPMLGDSKLSFDSLQIVSPLPLKIEHFEINGKTETQADKYNFIAGLNIKKIEAPFAQEPNASFNFNYSLKNLTATNVNNIMKLISKTPENPEAIEAAKKEMANNLLTLVVDGFELNIDQLKLQSSKIGNLDLKIKAGVEKSKDKADFSLEDKLKVNVDYLATGMLGQQLYSKLPPELLSGQNPNQLKLTFEYQNKKAKYNNIENKDMEIGIRTELRKMDNKLGIMKNTEPLIIPTAPVISEETTQPQPQYQPQN